MDQSGLDSIQIHQADGAPGRCFDHHVVDLRVAVNGAELKPALFARIFEYMCKATSLFDKVKTMLHFRAGLESVLRECPVKVYEIARCDVETLQRVGEFINGQITNEILESAECVPDLTRMICILDGIE